MAEPYDPDRSTSDRLLRIAQERHERERAAPSDPALAEAVRALAFQDLRDANATRQAEWDPTDAITLGYRGNELAGEVGEACNVIKKLERERLGIRGTRATVEQLAEELADAIICIDLIAMQAGVDLGTAVVAKFNATSAKYGLATKLEAAARRPPAPTGAVSVADIERVMREHVWDSSVRTHDAARAIAALLPGASSWREGAEAMREAAARWHDEQALTCERSIATAPVERRESFSTMAFEHRQYAKAIRALPAPAAPSPPAQGAQKEG